MFLSQVLKTNNLIEIKKIRITDNSDRYIQ
jgi:hypothetical protein